MGNIVGSNIFNIFFILGTTATVQPVRAGGIGVLDLVVMTAAALLLYIFALLFGDKVIKRGVHPPLLLYRLHHLPDHPALRVKTSDTPRTGQ